MSDFKVGDKVLAIEGWVNQITKGKTYTVTSRWINGVRVINDLGQEGVYSSYRFKPVETIKETESMFVKTETTTKKVIQEVVNRYRTGGACVSVKPHGDLIKLVVGASMEDENRCVFSKFDLQELINDLQEVHDAMSD
jgi:hypothetical protein